MAENGRRTGGLKVTVARSAGFCFGVRRAVQTCYEQAQIGGKPVYTYGPIIHNELVVDDLKEKGIVPVRDEAGLSGISQGTVIIRSHGVPKRICDQIEAQGLRMVDATCPFVKRIHRIVQERTAAGWDVIIIGKASHPEVEGICGWACPEGDAGRKTADVSAAPGIAPGCPQDRLPGHGEGGAQARRPGCGEGRAQASEGAGRLHPRVRVIETEEEALALVRAEEEKGKIPAAGFSAQAQPAERKEGPDRQEDEPFNQRRLCIVSQTTFQPEKFNNLVEILKKLRYSVVDVLNTICNATEERQSEARSLAAASDAMLVIGGRNSSNTQKLYEICKKECPSTFFIQKLVDLDIRQLPSCGCLGITAGASTPNNLIEEVSKRCQK